MSRSNGIVAYVPNIITSLRMVAAFCMVPVEALSRMFYVFLTFCGVSDIVDGFIARKFHLTSDFGAKLDSVADLLFWGVVLVKVLPVMAPEFTMVEYGMLAIIMLLRLATYVIAYIKFKAFPSLHTYLNKLTAVTLFVVVYFMRQIPIRTICLVVFIVSLVAVVEELIIHICSKEKKADIHSVFCMKSKKKETA